MSESHSYEWVMSHIWVRHVSCINKGHLWCMNESCLTYAWISLIWMSHVSHMSEACLMYEWGTSLVYEWVMSRIWVNLTHMNESCLTYEWGMSHVRIRPISNMNQAYHTYEWVMSQVLANVTHMNETCQIQACSVSRINESCPRLSTRLHYPRPRLHYNRTLLQYTLSRLPFCSALGLFYTPIGRCRVSHTHTHTHTHTDLASGAVALHWGSCILCAIHLGALHSGSLTLQMAAVAIHETRFRVGRCCVTLRPSSSVGRCCDHCNAEEDMCRSLLQKSPIKESIYCKRDLYFHRSY